MPADPQQQALPPLPIPFIGKLSDFASTPLFSADQMRAYAAEAVAHFLDRTGQYITNDASRNAAIDAAVSRALEEAAQSRKVPDGWKLIAYPLTEEMHVAACKALHRAPGLNGLPQRMLDAMIAVTPSPSAAAEETKNA